MSRDARWLGRFSRVALATVTLLAGLSAGGEAVARPRAPGGSEHAAGVVNINSASESQLELLPGVGPSKARAIVAYRSRRKFKAPHDLIRVRGIGRKTFRRLRRYLTVTGPTTLSSPPAKPPRSAKSEKSNQR